MLCLTRNVHEVILLQIAGMPDIVITLLEVRGTQKARIGIDAPECVKVLRAELLEQKQ